MQLGIDGGGSAGQLHVVLDMPAGLGIGLKYREGEYSTRLGGDLGDEFSIYDRYMILPPLA